MGWETLDDAMTGAHRVNEKPVPCSHGYRQSQRRVSGMVAEA